MGQKPATMPLAIHKHGIQGNGMYRGQLGRPTFDPLVREKSHRAGDWRAALAVYQYTSTARRYRSRLHSTAMYHGWFPVLATLGRMVHSS